MRVQVTGPGRALYAIVFSCGFVACTEVNYHVSVSIQTLGARVRKISGALDAVWLWSRCSLRYAAEIPYEERLTLAVWFEFAEELLRQFVFVESEAFLCSRLHKILWTPVL